MTGRGKEQGKSVNVSTVKWKQKRQQAKSRNVSTEKGKGIYVGVQDDLTRKKRSSNCDFDDGLGDIWREMTLALEFSKNSLIMLGIYF
ncbi:hypothetical protein Syun_022746 [Stephania yunnanensis]|uniref:Uncharacterized protein n=1 Tax=Stephania yunnanensis TaxID=152371 RepID=A0AAP0F7J8_9MAGN